MHRVPKTTTFYPNFAYCMQYAPYRANKLLKFCLLHAECTMRSMQCLLCLLVGLLTWLLDCFLLACAYENKVEYQKPALFPKILLTACSTHHAVSKQTPQILLTACSTIHAIKSTQNHPFFLKFCLLHAVCTMHKVPKTTNFFSNFAYCMQYKVPKPP